MISAKTSFALSTTAAALCSIFLPVSAFSQSVVNNKGEQSAPVVLVTANRQAQAASDVLADHVLISADEIAKSGASTIVDLLQQQRGVEVARNGGPGTLASVF
ncbi:MAG: TonB-dependent receptor, partial [Burkholderiaceae bacterium]|nr:TonB-dependent receptor [Burkholderiaceae bacterium]